MANITRTNNSQWKKLGKLEQDSQSSVNRHKILLSAWQLCDHCAALSAARKRGDKSA